MRVIAAEARANRMMGCVTRGNDENGVNKTQKDAKDMLLELMMSLKNL